MLNRWIEGGLLDVLGREGVGCIAFSPLAQGVLTGKYLGGVPTGSRAAQNGSLSSDQISERTLAHVRALAAIAARHGADASVVVATHGAIIRAVVNHVSPDTDAHLGVPIRNGSVHSFEFAGDGLVLREFDDPIEVESERPGTFDFDYQNALERDGSDQHPIF